MAWLSNQSSRRFSQRFFSFSKEGGREMEIQTHLRAPAAFKSDSNARPHLLTTSPVLSVNDLQTWGTSLRTCATGQRILTLNSVYLPCVSSGSCLWLFFLGYLYGIMRSQIHTGLNTKRRKITQVILRMTSTSDIQVSASFCFLSFFFFFNYCLFKVIYHFISLITILLWVFKPI